MPVLLSSEEGLPETGEKARKRLFMRAVAIVIHLIVTFIFYAHPVALEVMFF